MSGLSAEVLDLVAAEQLRSAWRDLAHRCLEPSVFNEPDFVLAAARHLARRPKPAFVAIWGEPGELVGLCPVLGGWRPRWIAARQWTHAQATEAYPLLDRERASDVFQALLLGLSRVQGGPAAMLWTALPEAGPTAAIVRACGRAYLRLDPRTRAILKQGAEPNRLSTKTRKELGRQERRLSEQGPLRFSSAAGPTEVAAALERFLSLEGQGWKGRRGSALASGPATRTFAVEALAALAARGQCRIDSLDVGNRPAAMGIVLRTDGRAFYWKTAYDESLARFSPGVQLTLRLSAGQLNQNVAWTDSCAIPGHSMIDRLWSDRVEVADYLVAIDDDRSTAFSLACATERTARGLRARAKTLAARLRPGI